MTIEECINESYKYKYMHEFRINSPNHYCFAQKNELLKKISEHLLYKQNPHGYWTKEKCLEMAKKYVSMSEICQENSKLYAAIYRLKINEEVYRIVGRKGNKCFKCIYSYEFQDNTVYVGLTYDIDIRDKNRKKDNTDSVTKHIMETGLQPVRKQLTDYIDVNEAIIMEGVYVEKYRNEGWIILNRVKTGAIGGAVVKHTFEACLEEAKKYNTKPEYKRGNCSSYTTAKHNGWLNTICMHMEEVKKKNGYYSKEKCIEIGSYYNNLKDFIKDHTSCYTMSKRKGWLDEVIGHMEKDSRKPNGYWNEETCIEEAKNCEYRDDFYKISQGAYRWVRRHNFLDVINQYLIDKPLRKDSKPSDSKNKKSA